MANLRKNRRTGGTFNLGDYPKGETGPWSSVSTSSSGFEISAYVDRLGGKWVLKRQRLEIIGDTAGDFPEDYYDLPLKTYKTRAGAVRAGQAWISKLEDHDPNEPIYEELDENDQRVEPFGMEGEDN